MYITNKQVSTGAYVCAYVCVCVDSVIYLQLKTKDKLKKANSKKHFLYLLITSNNNKHSIALGQPKCGSVIENAIRISFHLCA